jgi:hypothetical protein
MNGAYNFNLYIKVFKLLVLFALAPVVCEVLVAQYIVFCVEFCLLSFDVSEQNVTLVLSNKITAYIHEV